MSTDAIPRTDLDNLTLVDEGDTPEEQFCIRGCFGWPGTPGTFETHAVLLYSSVC